MDADWPSVNTCFFIVGVLAVPFIFAFNPAKKRALAHIAFLISGPLPILASSACIHILPVFDFLNHFTLPFTFFPMGVPQSV